MRGCCHGQAEDKADKSIRNMTPCSSKPLFLCQALHSMSLHCSPSEFIAWFPEYIKSSSFVSLCLGLSLGVDEEQVPAVTEATSH